MKSPLYKGFTLEITNKWWPLTTLNRWPLYRIKIYSKMHRESKKVTNTSRWPLYKGDRYDRWPLYKGDHYDRWPLLQVTIIQRWPIRAGDHYTKVTVTTGDHYTKVIITTGDHYTKVTVTTGDRYEQVTIIQRWPLQQVWLYSHKEQRFKRFWKILDPSETCFSRFLTTDSYLSILPYLCLCILFVSIRSKLLKSQNNRRQIL